MPVRVLSYIDVPPVNRVLGPYSKLWIKSSLLCVWWDQEQFLFTQNGIKFLKHVESKAV